MTVEPEREGAEVLGEPEARGEEAGKVVWLRHRRRFAHVHREGRPGLSLGRDVGESGLVDGALDIELVPAALPVQTGDLGSGRDDGVVGQGEEGVKADAERSDLGLVRIAARDLGEAGPILAAKDEAVIPDHDVGDLGRGEVGKGIRRVRRLLFSGVLGAGDCPKVQFDVGCRSTTRGGGQFGLPDSNGSPSCAYSSAFCKSSRKTVYSPLYLRVEGRIIISSLRGYSGIRDVPTDLARIFSTSARWLTETCSSCPSARRCLKLAMAAAVAVVRRCVDPNEASAARMWRRSRALPRPLQSSQKEAAGSDSPEKSCKAVL